MSKSKVYMNAPSPTDIFERERREMFDHLIGVRPLDGTNQAWRYKADEKDEPPLRRLGGLDKTDLRRLD